MLEGIQDQDEWRPAKDIKGSRWLVSEFHCRDLAAPQHIYTINFASLPFFPISNFTNTPNTVSSDWAMGQHLLGLLWGEGKYQGLSPLIPYHLNWTYFLTWAYIIQLIPPSKLMSSSNPISRSSPVTVISSSLGEVCPCSYIVYQTQLTQLSFISEDNHCIR